MESEIELDTGMQNEEGWLVVSLQIGSRHEVRHLVAVTDEAWVAARAANRVKTVPEADGVGDR